jgi:hypothetical protein
MLMSNEALSCTMAQTRDREKAIVPELVAGKAAD